MLGALRDVRADAAVNILGERVSRQPLPDHPGFTATLVESLKKAGAAEALATVLSRCSAEQGALDKTSGVASLLWQLHGMDAGGVIAALLRRGLARQADLTWMQGVGELLRALKAVGAGDEVTALARRVARQSPSDAGEAAGQLHVLRDADSGNAVITAAAQRSAALVSLDDPGDQGFVKVGVTVCD